MKTITVSVLLCLIFFAASFSVGTAQTDWRASINGNLEKNGINQAATSRYSENGFHKCTFRIGEVTDEQRKLHGLEMINRDGQTVYRLDDIGGSDIDISNSGRMIVYDHSHHYKGDQAIHVYSPNGRKSFTMDFPGITACSFSREGNYLFVRTSRGYHAINLENQETELLPQGFCIDGIEDPPLIAVAASGKICLQSPGNPARTIRMESEYPRSAALLPEINGIAVIDKKNISVYSLTTGELIFHEQLGENMYFRDLKHDQGDLLAGIHFKTKTISRGLLKSYDLRNFRSSVIEGETRIHRNTENPHLPLKTPGRYNSIPWPFYPFDSNRTVWNHYEQHMGYGTSDFSYLHQGLDLITPIAEPAYAVESGIVKCVLSIGGASYWRMAISDTQAEGYSNGWLYAHLIENTIQFGVGDTVQIHDYIGDIVEWTAEWGHIHFVNIRDSGLVWQYNDNEWGINFNPLLALSPLQDNTAPVFQPVFPNSKFAFCLNESSVYLNADSLYGDIDIIVRVADQIGNSAWQQPAYKIIYRIKNTSNGTVVLPSRLAHILNHIYPFYNSSSYEPWAGVIYKMDDLLLAPSWMDEERNFYHILTNSDGDSMIDLSEKNLSLQTASFPDGNYRIYVEALDPSGNAQTDSMDFQIRNDPVGISAEPNQRPQVYRLYPNHPNPFNPATSIRYDIPETGSVKMTLYNVLGQPVRRLVDEVQKAGSYRIIWDGRNDKGTAVSSGLYICYIRVNGFQKSGKLLLVR